MSSCSQLNLFSVVLNGQRPPVALLILCHFLHCGYTSEPPHRLRSPEAVSSRTMAGGHCHSTCYLDSSPCHPTVCCWCTIPLLVASTLQCRSRSGPLHSQVWAVRVLGVQNKDSYRYERCPLSIQLHSSRCDCGCLVSHVWWTGHLSSVGQWCSSHLHHVGGLVDSKTSTPLLCHRRSCTPPHALERWQSHNLCRSTDLGAVGPVLCQWWWAGGAGLTHVDVGHSHDPPQSTALLLQLTEELVNSLPRCGPIAYPVHPRLSLWVAGEYVVAGVSWLFIGEPQGAPLSLLSGGAVLGGVGWLDTCWSGVISRKNEQEEEDTSKDLLHCCPSECCLQTRQCKCKHKIRRITVYWCMQPYLFHPRIKCDNSNGLASVDAQHTTCTHICAMG